MPAYLHACVRCRPLFFRSVHEKVVLVVLQLQCRLHRAQLMPTQRRCDVILPLQCHMQFTRQNQLCS